MAITPKICLTVEPDLSKLYIEDNTGEYTINNEGGYGSPNNDRNVYAGVLYTKYTTSEDETELPVLTTSQIFYDAAYTNDEKSKFGISYSKDGWYTFVYTLVPTATTAEEGNIYYDTTAQELRIYTSGEFVTLTDLSLLDDPNQFETVKLDKLMDAKLTVKWNTLIESYNDCYFNCDTCKCDETFEQAEKLYLFIAAAQYRFGSNARLIAQGMIEKLIKIYL